jgi:hypothetical protein
MIKISLIPAIKVDNGHNHWSYTGIICLLISVSGCNRVPDPPANIISFIFYFVIGDSELRDSKRFLFIIYISYQSKSIFLIFSILLNKLQLNL